MDKNWLTIKNRLYKQFSFENFPEALAFINNIGKIAEQMNHHPKITNVYNQVEIELWTHDTNSITDLDYQLAVAIDNLI
jgi:4a-hydroxytetrahydrobiopterin dehydratase